MMFAYKANRRTRLHNQSFYEKTGRPRESVEDVPQKKKRPYYRSKKPTKTKLKKRADALFSEYIRKRDGACQKCGKRDTLQCAHIIGRTNLHLRYDPQNAITLCTKHHLWWAHKEPLDFASWLQVTFPDRIAYLEREKNKTEKPDYESIVTSLNGLLKGLEGR